MKRRHETTTAAATAEPQQRRRSFSLGKLYVTGMARETLTYDDILLALGRHSRCDWGDCCPEDWEQNDLSLDDERRLFSVYHAADGTKFWVITEADRSSTTVLFPSDY